MTSTDRKHEVAMRSTAYSQGTTHYSLFIPWGRKVGGREVSEEFGGSHDFLYSFQGEQKGISCRE